MNIRKKKACARVIIMGLLLTIAAWCVPTGAEPALAAGGHGLSNPVTAADGTVTWDCVSFGNYPQSYKGTGDKTKPENYNNEPIKWRVLSVNGDDAFLLADKILDSQSYNEGFQNVTWEGATIRSWLNGYGSNANVERKSYLNNNFIDKAFSRSEQSAIFTSNIVTEPNPFYGTSGGRNTQDKLFLLSVGEVTTVAYGFANNISKKSEKDIQYYTGPSRARTFQVTDYVNRICYDDNWPWGSPDAGIAGGSIWLLRTSGVMADCGTYVWNGGEVDIYGTGIGDVYYAVRPALHLNLESNTWSHAGTVTSSMIGWQKEGRVWRYYYPDGSVAVYWRKINDKWYYFFGNVFIMCTGWQKISGKWYLFHKTKGYMLTGWQKSGGKWYYLASNGTMKTGWQKISKKWYYFSSSGKMLTGKQKIGKKTYTFNKSGVWVA